MSPLPRLLAHATARLLRLVPVLAAASLATAGAAHAASVPRDVQYDLPSTQGNVDPARVQFNGTTKSLTAWVRLPAGYDDQPDHRWPVIYLLHGWEDSSDAWLDPQKGSLSTVLPADFDGIVVMPEGAKGWFINWASPKGNPGNQWGNYLLDEVVPFMEDHLRIAPGRANHAIGGLSMGGYGAFEASAALPSYFGQVDSFSGLVDNQDLSFSTILSIAMFGKPGYNSVFGPVTGAYATAMNPLKHPKSFALSRVAVMYGTPGTSQWLSLDIRSRGFLTLEIGVKGQSYKFVNALKTTTADVFANDLPGGSHNWPWWKQDLAIMVARGLWNAPPVTQTSQAKAWEYSTIAQHGNAWGIGYKFATAPTAEVKLNRVGPVLTGSGKGTITISGGAADDDSSGNGTRADCTFTTTLPFAKVLPSGC